MTVSAGLDVHKKKCHGVIMDEDGEVLKDEEFKNSLSGVKSFFQGFCHADAVIEASYSWRPTYERLEEIGIQAKLAHPHGVEAIASSETKTDSIDARTLAHLLRTGLVPEAYVPPRDIRELRDKTRLRAKLGNERSRMKAKIRAELEKYRIGLEENPFTKSGKEKLREIEIDSVDHYLAILETIGDRIEKLEEEFEEIVEDYEEAELLMTIPGISHFSALLILAEIGDIDRFPDPEKLCSYAGLVPKVHQSGGYKRLGGIKKERNKFLQWILIECVWIHVGCADSKLTKYYRRKKKEKGSKMAAIANSLEENSSPKIHSLKFSSSLRYLYPRAPDGRLRNAPRGAEGDVNTRVSIHTSLFRDFRALLLWITKRRIFFWSFTFWDHYRIDKSVNPFFCPSNSFRRFSSS